MSASVSEVYENSLHNYCSNGSFSDSKDKFTGWSRSDTAQITQTTFNNRSCAKIQNTTSTYNISWYQKPWAKKGNVTVRFKAACASEDAGTARIRVTIDGKTFYTAAGELSCNWKRKMRMLLLPLQTKQKSKEPRLRLQECRLKKPETIRLHSGQLKKKNGQRMKRPGFRTKRKGRQIQQMPLPRRKKPQSYLSTKPIPLRSGSTRAIVVLTLLF